MQGKKQSSAGIRLLAHFFLLHFGRVLSWTLKVLRCPCIWLMKPDGKEQPWEQVYSSSCYKLKSRIAGLLKLGMKRKQKTFPSPRRCPVPPCPAPGWVVGQVLPWWSHGEPPAPGGPRPSWGTDSRSASAGIQPVPFCGLFPGVFSATWIHLSWLKIFLSIIQ